MQNVAFYPTLPLWLEEQIKQIAEKRLGDTHQHTPWTRCFSADVREPLPSPILPELPPAHDDGYSEGTEPVRSGFCSPTA